MDNAAIKIVQLISDQPKLNTFSFHLFRWLAGENDGGQMPLSPSRARALLHAVDAVDEPTWNDFQALAGDLKTGRIALYDLLQDAGLSKEELPIRAWLTSPVAAEAEAVADWPALLIAAYAWQRGYPLQQLDPASPPGPFTPAGQVLKRSGQFMRRQVQRSATEKDRIDRRLSAPPADAPSLDELPDEAPVAPVPPHFRPPVPERYPEMARETLQVSGDEPLPPQVSRGEPLVITNDDLPDEPRPERMPPISISAEQLEPVQQEQENQQPAQEQTISPMPPTGVIMPNSSVDSRPSFSMAVRQMLGQEEMKSTRLEIVVQQYPDGPGLYGLQIQVTCKGIKSFVAGTTDREGKFLCELPVRLNAGLTYDVDVTWPRELGGEVERKSITLNADRTRFKLPFYRQLNGDGE